MPDLLAPLVHFFIYILQGLTHALHNYGLAIIIFTIIIRALLTPLNLRALRSQKRMAEFAPRIKELQQKYKDDRQALAAAQMALYKEEGINPVGGCLPLLIQLPIIYSLFNVFRDLAHKGTDPIFHQNFLWFTLDKPDSLFGHFVLGGYWGPLALLAGITQWIQTRMMLQPTSDPQQRSQQQIMQFMPLLIIAFAVNYPAGLALYWVVTTLYAIGLQYFVTGWGQLFASSPFSIPHPSGHRPQTLVSGAPKNEKGQKPAIVHDSRVDEGPLEETDEPLGKMQRAVTRQSPKVRPRSRKGAKR